MITSKKKLKVGLSIGDVNGVGIEVIIKSFLDNRMMEFCTPVIFGSSKVISYHRKALGIKDFSCNPIKTIKDVNLKRANLFNVWEEDVEINLGASTSISLKLPLTAHIPVAPEPTLSFKCKSGGLIIS